jgi:hypothetical protein
LTHRLNVDALIFCLVWAALAIFAWDRAGMKAGLICSIGLFPVIMLSSATILSRTGSFAAERTVRWGILAVAMIGLASYLDAAG